MISHKQTQRSMNQGPGAYDYYCFAKVSSLILNLDPEQYLKRRWSCALELSETCCPITLSCFDAHHINEPNFWISTILNDFLFGKKEIQIRLMLLILNFDSHFQSLNGPNIVCILILRLEPKYFKYFWVCLETNLVHNLNCILIQHDLICDSKNISTAISYRMRVKQFIIPSPICYRTKVCFMSFFFKSQVLLMAEVGNISKLQEEQGLNIILWCNLIL